MYLPMLEVETHDEPVHITMPLWNDCGLTEKDETRFLREEKNEKHELSFVVLKNNQEAHKVTNNMSVTIQS